MIQTGELRSGSVVAGKFRLDRRLPSSGGQGTVWVGVQVSDGVEVAIKVMRPDDQAKALQAVRLESKALRQIRENPHVAGIIDSGVADGVHYVVSRLVRGENLEVARARSGGRLSDADLRRAAFGSLSALAACREANVVHRDIKPSNLVLDGDTGAVVLVDFGISVSLLASTTPPAGITMRFMAPEYEAAKPPHQYDIFSWASTMVFLATGHFAFCNDVPEEGLLLAMASVLADPAPKPDLTGVPGWLLPMVTTPFCHDPLERPHADELLAFLTNSVPRADPTEIDRSRGRPVTPAGPGGPRWTHSAAGHPVLTSLALVAGLVAWRLAGGSGLWPAALGCVVAGVLLAAIANPPTVPPGGRTAWVRWRARWFVPVHGGASEGHPHTRWCLPSPEFAVMCALVGFVASRTVLAPLPATDGTERALGLATVSLGVAASAVVRSSRIAPVRHDGFLARFAVPLACVALPIIALQLRALHLTHVSVAGRLVPWWSLFVVSVAVALWGGVGALSVRSLPFRATVLVACALTGAGSLIWAALYHPIPGLTAWSLFTTEVRAVLVAAAMLAMLPMLFVSLHGWTCRLAVTVALPAAVVAVVLICWWTGWIPSLDPWVEFHLWERFIPIRDVSITGS